MIHVDIRTGTVRRLPEVDGVPLLDPGPFEVKLEATVTDAIRCFGTLSTSR